jgi:glycerate 2-kinase
MKQIKKGLAMSGSKEITALKDIFSTALRRADPYEMVRQHLRLQDERLVINREEGQLSLPLDRFSRIMVLGAGKAGARMALAAEEVLGGYIDEGLVAVKRPDTAAGAAVDTAGLRRIRLTEGGHPVPDANSVAAAQEIARLCRDADENTLIVNLISGGGSALLSLPLEWRRKNSLCRLSLAEKQQTTRELLASGAVIQEVNCIRKHLSAIKGGRLAELMYPATSVNLILSDVVGDRLDSIASGLTSHDQTSFADAVEIVKHYGLEKKLPEAAMEILEAGRKGEIPETPAKGDPAFSRAHNILIGTNLSSLRAAHARAEAMGYHSLILSSQITGEAREIAKFYLGIARDIRKNGLPAPTPACIIAGGETTVTLRGGGRGGRNQEMALSFLRELSADPDSSEGVYFLAASTDGNDGPTDAAGAFACLELAEASREAGLDSGDYLGRSDSYSFFERIGGLYKTGLTGTNVCDLQILIVR